MYCPRGTRMDVMIGLFYFYRLPIALKKKNESIMFFRLATSILVTRG